MQWSNNCAPISPTQLSERFKSCNPVLISNAAAIRAIPSIFPVKSVMLLDEKSNLVNVLQPPQMKKNTTTGREETKKSMRGSRTQRQLPQGHRSTGHSTNLRVPFQGGRQCDYAFDCFTVVGCTHTNANQRSQTSIVFNGIG